jgi:hypothetical protein
MHTFQHVEAQLCITVYCTLKYECGRRSSVANEQSKVACSMTMLGKHEVNQAKCREVTLQGRALVVKVPIWPTLESLDCTFDHVLQESTHTWELTKTTTMHRDSEDGVCIQSAHFGTPSRKAWSVPLSGRSL